MSWLEYIFLSWGYIAIIFDLTIICMSFKKEFKKHTLWLSLFLSGFAVSSIFFAVYALIERGKLLYKVTSFNILLFTIWIIYVILFIVTLTLHLYRMFGKRGNTHLYYE